MAKYVVTAIGADRPGLVSALATAIAEASGNWLESQMGRLAGSFAGIVLVEVPEGCLEKLRGSIDQLGADGLLDVSIARAGERVAEAPAGSPLHVFVVGHDRPGIVREVSAALASLGVGIVTLETVTRAAPMGGWTLFEAEADVLLPDGVAENDVREAIEALAQELVVDLEAPEGDGA